MKHLLLATLITIPFPGEGIGDIACAQRIPHASMMMRGGTYNATPVPFRTDTDINLCKVPEAPILWGLDTAWDSEDNVTRGTNHIGTGVMRIGRVSFQPSDLVDDNGNLSSAQQTALQSRLNHIRISGVRDVILNCDHEALNSSNYYAKPEEWYKVIKASVKYIRTKGFNVITVSPFNEPDYTPWGEGTKAHFRSIAKKIAEDAELQGIRISAGNTLNCDQALSWYNYMKPYVTEGNTHQLAGGFDTYAAFWQQVRADGNHATADELHNVGEAFIGAHYGMQSGVWWGWDGAARGRYCKASFAGKEIGYAENRSAWTAATVYKCGDGRIDAFVGSSERQATTSAFDFTATDRPVYYDGYGPVYNYTMTIPGGTGYQTGQTNAERLIQINKGEDVPLDNLANGTFVIMNKNSGKCLGFYNGAKGEALNITQMAYSSSSAATHQQWIVEPVSERVGGDYSYFLLRNVRNTAQVMDVKDWSTSAGGEIIGYSGSGGTNEQWFAEYAGEGNWYLRSRHSGLYLEIRNSSTIRNAYLQQAAFTGTPNQQWRFMPVKAKLESDAPTAPKNLRATPLSASVKLEWDANGETDIEAYCVLRAVAGAELTNSDSWDMIGRMIAGTEFVDNSAVAGVQYVYKLKAVDKSRNMSEASATVTAGHGGSRQKTALVAHYVFDESTNDITENVFDAVVEGTHTYNTIENQEKTGCIALGGTAYLMLPPAATHHSDMTVSAWVNVTGTKTWQRIFDFGNSTDQYFFLTPNNGSGMSVVMKNGGEEQRLTTATLQDGWHHVAVTLSPDAVTLHIDGEQAATTADITIRPIDFMPVRCYIGRSQFAADPLLTGSIADLRIYNSALTPADIKNIIDGGDPTAIHSVKDNSASARQGRTYTIGGQAVNNGKHTKGVYIINGKKVIE